MISEPKKPNPRVFILQTPRFSKDLSSAQRYGKIVFLIRDGKLQASMNPGKARQHIEDGLLDEGYNPGEDYLLFLGGDPFGAIMWGQILQERWPGKQHNYLRWEREKDLNGERIKGHGFYVPTVLGY